MKYYFSLQFTLLKRRADDFGVPFWIAIILLLLVYAGLFQLFDRQPQWAPYLVFFIGISICSPLSQTDRNDFLKSLYRSKDYRYIRNIENLLLVFLLVVALLVKAHFLMAIGLLTCSLLLANFSFKISTNKSLPAPFTRYPFEMQIFFRQYWWLLFTLYFIAFMSWFSENYNLGIFTIAIAVFFTSSALENTGPDLYVWNYNKTPSKFLWLKIWRINRQFSLLLSPIYAALCLRFPHQIHITLAVIVLSILVLSTLIVLIYSVFPQKMGLPMGFLFALCFFVPFLTLIVFPYYYLQATKNLSKLL